MNRVIFKTSYKNYNLDRGFLRRYFPYYRDISSIEYSVELHADLDPTVFDTLLKCAMHVENQSAQLQSKKVNEHFLNYQNFLNVLRAAHLLLAKYELDHYFAHEVDRRKIFFTQSTSKLKLSNAESEAFVECAKFLWNLSDLNRLKKSFLILLIWVSQRAVHSDWFHKLPVGLFDNLTTLTTRRFGLEEDINRLVIRRLEQPIDDVDFNRFGAMVSRLQYERINPQKSFQIRRELVRDWSNAKSFSKDKILDLVRSSVKLTLGDEEMTLCDTNEMVLKSALKFMNEARVASVCYYADVHLPADENRFPHSPILSVDGALIEYNEYLGLYRVLCLPEKGFCGNQKTDVYYHESSNVHAINFDASNSRVTLWSIDLKVLQQGVAHYAWEKTRDFDEISDILVPNQNAAAPHVVLLRNESLRWRLFCLDWNESVNLDQRWSFTAAATFPIGKCACGIYLVGRDGRTEKLSVIECKLFKKEDGTIRCVKRELSTFDRGPILTTVFYDEDLNAPLLLSSYRSAKRKHTLRVARMQHDGQWEFFASAFETDKSVPDDSKLNVHFSGVLRKNQLVLWNADITPKDEFFAGRYICVDLLDKKIRWRVWNATLREEKRNKQKFDPDVVRTFWNRKTPVTTTELPTPRHEKPVKFVYDRAFVPSSREHFWVSSNDKRENAENWMSDYSFSAVPSPSLDIK